MNPQTRAYVKFLREEYKKILSAKNSWGKNEALTAFDMVVTDTVLEFDFSETIKDK